MKGEWEEYLEQTRTHEEVLPAVLPPPEEVKQVETAIGAARAENLRDDMLKSKH